MAWTPVTFPSELAAAMQAGENGKECWAQIERNMQVVTVERSIYISQGNEVPGFIIRPKGAGPWPVLVYVRGGYREFSMIRLYDLWYSLATIARAGFVVVTTQKQGGYGAQGKDTWGGDAHVTDIHELLESVKDFPQLLLDKVGLWGMSRGGIEAWRYAMHYPEHVAGVVTIGTPTDIYALLRDRPDLERVYREAFAMEEEALWQRSVVHCAESFPQEIPFLCLHGSQDQRVPVEQAEGWNALSSQVEVRIVEGGDHSLSNWSQRDTEVIQFFKDRYV